MDSAEFFAISISCSLIYLIIFYHLIRNATGSLNQQKEMLRQSLLLQSMAKKLGVSDEEITNINSYVKSGKIANQKVKSEVFKTVGA